MPRLELLETRLAPANNITVIDNGVGTLDAFLSANDGTITTADLAGVDATLSRAALQGVNANVNISITAAQGIAFNALTSGALALNTTAGNSATFTANAADITGGTNDIIKTAGGGLNFAANTLLDLGILQAGAGPVVLTATTGDINARSVSGSTLAMTAATGIGTVSRIDTAVSALAANGGSGGVDITSGGTLTVGTVGALSGISATGGAISVRSNGGMNVNKNITGAGNIQLVTSGVNDLFVNNTTIANTGGNTITIRADRMALANGHITAGNGGGVDLATGTFGNVGGVSRLVNLGPTTDPSGSLNLSNAELNTVAAAILKTSTLDNINITAAISGGTHFATLSLAAIRPFGFFAGTNNVAQTGAGAVSVTNLAVQGDSGVSMATNPNTVTGNLAGSTNVNGPFNFTNSTAITLGTVDGQSGINAGTGTVGLRAANSAILNGLAAGNDVTAASLGLNGVGGLGTKTIPLTLAVGMLTTKSGNAAQFLASAGTTTINSLDAGTQGIVLTGGTFALSGNNQISANSPVRLAGATLDVGAFSNTIASLTLSASSTLSATINSFSAGNFGNLTVNQFGYNLANGTGDLTLKAGFVPPPSGSVITLIRDANNAGVLGTFAGLPEGTVFMVGGFSFRISYMGGAGHDVTLTKV